MNNNSKNLVISFLVLIVLVVAGFAIYGWKKSASDQAALNNAQPQNSTTTVTIAPGTAAPQQNSPAVSTPKADAPIVRTSTTVSTSNSTAMVNGTVNPNGAATSYWYEYGETTALGTRTSVQAMGSGFTAITAPGYITGLRANTSYYFRLSASNRFSTVNGATNVFKTNSNPAPQGTIPSTRTNEVSNITRASADLHGQVNPNNSDTSYWFEYGETKDLGNVTGIQTVGNGNAYVPVSVSLSGLKPLAKYYYRVNAQNQFGTVNGATLNFTTAGPQPLVAPTVHTDDATSVGTSTAVLNGHITPNSGETKYWFQYSKDRSMSTVIGTISPSATIAANASSTALSTSIGDLQDNTKYYFRIVGQNAYGTVEGDTVSFVTKPQ
ncbi:MAG: hypothetical protein JWO73_236 [Candidatus Taylorbacteria bacterium]|nr:hypothetical protein [Candidatus Taylorbacteria bacterium]